MVIDTKVSIKAPDVKVRWKEVSLSLTNVGIVNKVKEEGNFKGTLENSVQIVPTVVLKNPILRNGKVDFKDLSVIRTDVYNVDKDVGNWIIFKVVIFTKGLEIIVQGTV